MASVAEVLVRVTGDVDDAETALAKLEAELKAFNQADADATISLDDAAFKAELETALAKLDLLDAKDVNVDVDSSDISKLNKEAHAAGGGFDFMGGHFGGMVKTIVAGAPLLSGAVSIIVALASTLASAALSTGALAVAFGATLFPAAALVIGAIRDFKNHSDDAGTAANDLKKAAGDLGKTFDQTLRPAADAVLGALAKALPDIGGAIAQLKPQFTDLGNAVGVMISKVADFLTSKKSVDFFKDSISTLADIVKGPGTDAFISFSKVLMNIADAAFPVLKKAAEDFADAMKGVADSTSDIDNLRQHIQNGYDDLKSWLDIAKQLGGILAGVFKAALPDGRSLVDALDQGAHSLNDWVNSAKGQNAIKDFFDKVIPPAEHILGLLGKLVEAFLAWSQISAPVVDALIKAVGFAVDALTDLLGAVNKLPGPIKDVLALIVLFGGSKIMGAIGSLISILGGKLAGAFGIAGKAAGEAQAEAQILANMRFIGLIGAIGAMVEAFKAGIPVGHKLADTMTNDVAQNIADALDIPIKKANQVVAYMKNHPGLGASEALAAIETQPAIDKMDHFVQKAEIDSGAVAQAWQKLVPSMKGILDDFTSAITSKGPDAVKAAKGLAQAGVAAIKALTGDFKGAGQELAEAFATAVGNKEPLSKNAGSALGRAVKDGIESHNDDVNEAGKNHGDKYAGGVSSKDGAATNAGNTVARAAKQAINDLAGDFTDAGDNHGSHYANALEATKGAASAAAKAIAAGARDAASSVDFNSVGAKMGNAIASGIRSAQNALVSVAQSVAAAVVSAYNAYVDSHPVKSPHGGGGGSGKVATSDKLGGDLLNGLGLNLMPTVVVTPVAVPAMAGGGFVQNNNIQTAGGGYPDPRHLEAQLALLARLRGGLSG